MITDLDNQPKGSNSNIWAFHFKMTGYDTGSMGLPLNREFMQELAYIKGYAAGILEYQRKMERIEKEWDECRMQQPGF
jgi:hypothetical protein